MLQIVLEVWARGELDDASEVPQPAVQDSVNGQIVFGLGALAWPSRDRSPTGE